MEVENIIKAKASDVSEEPKDIIALGDGILYEPEVSIHEYAVGEDVKDESIEEEIPEKFILVDKIKAREIITSGNETIVEPKTSFYEDVNHVWKEPIANIFFEEIKVEDIKEEPHEDIELKVVDSRKCTYNNLECYQDNLYSEKCESQTTYKSNIKDVELYKYKCDKCDYRAKQQSKLNLHIMSVHEGVKYNCDQCGYQATQKSSLSRHKLSVHEGIKYSCDQCDSQFTNLNSLGTHKQSVHAGVKFNCDKCSYQATRKDHLKKHKLSLHEGIKYYCHQCDFEASESGTVRKHKLRVHEGVKYKCDQCDYQTTTPRSLKVHRLGVHEGIKYKCHMCDYQSIWQDALKKHIINIHEEVKEVVHYLCNLCDSHFTDPNSLRRHKRTVHEGVKFNCDKCSYQAARKYHLNRHKLSSHDPLAEDVKREIIGDETPKTIILVDEIKAGQMSNFGDQIKDEPTNSICGGGIKKNLMEPTIFFKDIKDEPLEDRDIKDKQNSYQYGKTC